MSPLSRKPLSENFCNRQYCFLRHSFVNVMDPSTNVIFPERQIKEISLTSTAEVNLILCQNLTLTLNIHFDQLQIICGMLNSNKGGHIHIGITSSGQVDGVRVDFDSRDGFRSGKKNKLIQRESVLINL